MTVQKPPAVCKHPPKKISQAEEHYSQRPLSAVVQWFDKANSPPIAGAFFFCLAAEPLLNVHSGISDPSRFRVDLTMTTDPDTEMVEIECLLLDNDIPRSLATTLWIHPRATDPFHTGMILIQRLAQNQYVHASIYL